MSRRVQLLSRFLSCTIIYVCVLDTLRFMCLVHSFVRFYLNYFFLFIKTFYVFFRSFGIKTSMYSKKEQNFKITVTEGYFRTIRKSILVKGTWSFLRLLEFIGFFTVKFYCLIQKKFRHEKKEYFFDTRIKICFFKHNNGKIK